VVIVPIFNAIIYTSHENDKTYKGNCSDFLVVHGSIDNNLILIYTFLY
jgi:hypothetical protein